MPKVNNIRRKLTSHLDTYDIQRLCKDPERLKRGSILCQGRSYTHGIPGCDYWVDCIGNGRDIRYGWGADGNDWVDLELLGTFKKENPN